MSRPRLSVPYVPLWVKSNYSFLEGASHPEELVTRADELGFAALALTDRDGLYGAVRAHVKCKQLREEGSTMRMLVGAQVTVIDEPEPPELAEARRLDLAMRMPVFVNEPRYQADDGTRRLVLLAETREGYGRLGTLLTRGHARAERKGAARVTWDEVRTIGAEGLVAIALDDQSLTALADSHRGRLYALATRHYTQGDVPREQFLRTVARRQNVPVLAGREVLYHDRSRRPLQDVLTCIRHGETIYEAGTLLRANDEHDLLDIDLMIELFRDDPAALWRTVEVAERCTFDLGQLRYRYPAEKVPHGRDPKTWLRELTLEGAKVRYPEGVPREVHAQIDRELEVIEELDYGGYFLTMWDVVRFCREANILCQGRGSAANSIVCYCLGITAIDPVRMDLLFERFISRERAEPPDIDLDIEHARREEVIQYVYERWGRAPSREEVERSRQGSPASEPSSSPPARAAMVANVIRYRPKSALRDVGKVFGLHDEMLDAMGKLVSQYDDAIAPSVVQNVGLDPRTPVARHLVRLSRQLLDFPRHLGIHPGGFLLGHEPVETLCPIERATMPGRTVVQWDKQDVEDLGLFKVDLLGLGALTVIHRAFDLLRDWEGLPLEIRTVPAEDPTTYAMISRGDTVGVFQIESRAQMAMLPRLRPRTFYDLVIEVAIVRPGPIQGDMVHPYLRRREGKEAVSFPHPKLERVLKKTLGVPIFQEQVMKLAVAVAGYTPGEADQLRRDMAAWRSKGRIEQHHEKLVSRMVEDGIPLEFAERVFNQIRGFGEYGFPESHAASFALLAYVTAWLKCHHPAIYACALLDAWPMGFYHPSTVIDDARRHGVVVLPIDVQKSTWSCTLEAVPHRGWGIRMGLRYVKGLGVRERDAFLRAREERSSAPRFVDLADFARRTRMHRRALQRIAEAGGFQGLGLDRRGALWEIGRLAREDLAGLDWQTDPDGIEARQRDAERGGEQPAWMRKLGADEAIAWDYRASLHSTRGHPMEAFRERLLEEGYPEATAIAQRRRGAARFVGLVICRQRPQTATGVTFMTLEDETGFVNVVLWRDVYERYERIAKTTVLLEVHGRVQEESGVVHVIAESLHDFAEKVQRARRDDEGPRRTALTDLEKSRDFY